MSVPPGASWWMAGPSWVEDNGQTLAAIGCTDLGGYWEQTLAFCEHLQNMYDPACQPEFPIPADPEQPGGGGSWGGVVNYPRRVQVSICNYRLFMDSAGQQTYEYNEAISCARERSLDETERLLTALAHRFRPDAEFSGADSLDAVNECRDMKNWLLDALADAPERFGVSKIDDPDHFGGQSIVGERIAHLNAKLFRDLYQGDGSWRHHSHSSFAQLLAAALHEAAHGWGGKEHRDASNNVENGPAYTTLYFRRLTEVGGVNQCVR